MESPNAEVLKSQLVPVIQHSITPVFQELRRA
jgi:hypothetical protein